jgi:hypothetical protein
LRSWRLSALTLYIGPVIHLGMWSKARDAQRTLDTPVWNTHSIALPWLFYETPRSGMSNRQFHRVYPECLQRNLPTHTRSKGGSSSWQLMIGQLSDLLLLTISHFSAPHSDPTQPPFSSLSLVKTHSNRNLSNAYNKLDICAELVLWKCVKKMRD